MTPSSINRSVPYDEKIHGRAAVSSMGILKVTAISAGLSTECENFAGTSNSQRAKSPDNQLNALATTLVAVALFALLFLLERFFASAGRTRSLIGAFS